jgi:proline dehydrogenase
MPSRSLSRQQISFAALKWFQNNLPKRLHSMVTPTSVFAAKLAPADLADLSNQDKAAAALRRIARDEKLKAHIESDPALFNLLLRAARRYIGGVELIECTQTIKALNAQGILTTADYMGESTRTEAKARAETQHFLNLVQAIKDQRLRSGVSLDLSHIGLSIDQNLALENTRRIAVATHDAGLELMISMEGSERTDAILDTHAKLGAEFDHIGITVQARLRRTPADLAQLLKLPGRIRLVKGAYEEVDSTAHQRPSAGLDNAYRSLAAALIESHHSCSIATHDEQQIDWAHELIETRYGAVRPPHVEFETLLGLGPGATARTLALGYPTRQYVVYGQEWFLYVCHRIAEQPDRLFQAVADIVGIHQDLAPTSAKK